MKKQLCGPYELVDMMMEMEVAKPAEMVVNIPNGDFTGVTLAIGDSLWR